LTQSDPFSSIIFNILADVLAILIARAKEEGKVGSLIPHLVDGEFRFSNTPIIKSFFKTRH
jgi:hypothetical protein